MPYRLLTILVYLTFLSVSSYGQAVNTNVGDVVMPPPEAASLGKYGDIPVSYATGVPNIGIPIHTLKEGSLELNVGLSYHASGVRVTDQSSWVGLGWSLQYGGIVSRTVLGKPDERADGYMQTGPTIAIPEDSEECMHSDGFIPAVSRGAYDGEADLFFFSAGSYSGKFFIDTDGEPVLVPLQDVKVEYELNGNSSNILRLKTFTVTTPDGVRYEYGDVDGNDENIELLTVVGDFAYTSNWKLKRVTSHDGHHQINLNYEKEYYGYSTRGSYYYVSGTNSASGRETRMLIEGYRLASIHTSTESINFIPGEDRQDLAVHNPPRDPEKQAKQLSAIEVSSGNAKYCKRFNFDQDYWYDHTDDRQEDENDYRLRLNSLQETSCNAIGPVETVPPYVFTYTVDEDNPNFLPNRHSRAIDHWGFYNGAHNNTSSDNIPPTKVIYYPNGPGSSPQVMRAGSADRESNPTAMQYGTINSIDYPTGGQTSFVFEANSYWDTEGRPVLREVHDFEVARSNQCGHNAGTSITETYYVSSANLPGLRYRAVTEPAAFNTGAGICCEENGGSFVYLQVHEVGGSRSYSANLPVSCSTGLGEQITGGFIEDLLPDLEAGKSYEFEITATNAGGQFYLIEEVSRVEYNRPVGGLRISSITSSDGIGLAEDVVKTYSYQVNSSTRSSGQLYNQPKYGFAFDFRREVECINTTYNSAVVVLQEFGVFPLSSFDGYHVNYAKVTEYQADDGHTTYEFETHEPYVADVFPTSPINYDVLATKMKSKRQLNGSTEEITSEFITPYVDEYVEGAGLNLKAIQINGARTGDGQQPLFIATTFYRHKTSLYRVARTVSTRDGVTTTTDIEYNGVSHLAPTAQEFINSTGKVHRVETKYPEDFTGAAYGEMGERNLLRPVEVTTVVGGDVVDATRTQYQLFDGHPYPANVDRYEVSWNEAGNRVVDGWQTNTTIHDYDDGFPVEATNRGWEKEFFTWTPAGQIATRTYEDFVWRYDYHSNTRLVARITDIDGQSVDYDYDGLMRFKSSSARDGNVTSAVRYSFMGQDTERPYSYVHSTSSIQPTVGSALEELSTYQYVDGLGRPIQLVRQQYGEDLKDVASATHYDEVGRPDVTYDPVASDHDNGQPILPEDYGDPTETEYDDDPLNRVRSTQSFEWHATTMLHGRNTVAINRLEGGSYSVASLYAQTVIDADGRESVTYTDKAGRTVASHRLNQQGTILAATSTEYDDKNRKKRVFPPGATTATPGLLYTYLYDGRDRVTTKKVPDQGPISYLYDNRDLLTFVQEANRAELDEALHTKYDRYGRVLSTGMVAGFPEEGTATPDYIEALTTTCYDGCKLTGTVPAVYLGKPMHVATRVLGSTQWMEQTSYYDAYGRVARTEGNSPVHYSDNQAESVAMVYDFADNLLALNRSHSPGVNQAAIAINDLSTYDHSGRPKRLSQSIDGNEFKVSMSTYSAKDQVVRKMLGHAPGTDWLQQVDYSFLPNGFLRGINEDDLQDSDLLGVEDCSPPAPTGGTSATSVAANDLFHLRLFYDEVPGLGTATVPQRNGNIAGYHYRTRGRTMQAYAFEYDGLDRLESADHAQQLAGGGYEQDAYNTTYSYDARGNFETLTRSGKMMDGDNCLQIGQIDNLSYSYVNGTNRLRRVTDEPVNEPGTEYIGAGGFYQSPTAPVLDYQYDANGNMIYDPVKELTIYYNYLNLPERFEFEDCRTINITYDAAGVKLRTQTYNGAQLIKEQIYAGGIEYLNGKLESVPHAEGRTYYDGADSRREYNLTDHLGNTRVVFSDLNGNGRVDMSDEASRSEVLMELNYYPFGLTMEGSWQEDIGRGTDYRFNGIKRNKELGLDMAEFRSYDPAIGRWLHVDPMAEAMPELTPYRFGFNNPISFADPSGLFEENGGGDDPNKREIIRDKDGNPTSVRLGYNTTSSGGTGRAGKNNSGLGTFVSINGSGGSASSSKNDNLHQAFGPQVTVTAPAPDHLWKVGDDFMTEHDVFAMGRANAALGAMLLRERFGTSTAIKFFQFDIISAQFEFANNYVNPALITIAPIPIYSSALSRFLPFVKPLRAKGGAINGFTISLSRRYGARSRIDFHTLMYPSKRSGWYPNWVKGRKMLHYHWGKGNSLRRHRPWEVWKSDKSFFSRF